MKVVLVVKKVVCRVIAGGVALEWMVLSGRLGFDGLVG